MKSITSLYQRRQQQLMLLLLFYICCYYCCVVDASSSRLLLFGRNKNHDDNEISVGNTAKQIHNDNDNKEQPINELLSTLKEEEKEEKEEDEKEEDDDDDDDDYEDNNKEEEIDEDKKYGEDKSIIIPDDGPPPTCDAVSFLEMSIWYKTDVYDSDSFVNYQTYHDFLEGPALSMNEVDIRFAVCEILPLPHYQHFAHAMQQLLRCFSWFAGHPKVPRRILWKHETFFDNFLTDNIISFLHQYYKVRLILNDTDIDIYSKYIVYSKNTTGLLDKTYDGNYLTDFAMLEMNHAIEFQTLFYHHISLYDQDNVANTNDGIDMESIGCTEMKRHPRIGIVNRLSTSKRYIVNDKELLLAIQKVHSSIELIYLEDMSFPDQVIKMMSFDIIISPHGSQLQHIMFMPSQGCSSIIEILPADYFIPDFYGSLSKLFNITHSFFYMDDSVDLEDLIDNDGTGLETKYHKVISTTHINKHICVDTKKVTNAITKLMNDWYTCCTAILK